MALRVAKDPITVCFAVFMHHIIIQTQQLIPDPKYTWLLNRFRHVGPNKIMQLQFSWVKTFLLQQILSWTLRVFIAAPHNVVNAQLWRFKGWKPIWNKWAVTRLMSVTKVDCDCQSLFCLLVGERAISIALTVHQSFWNWILFQSGCHKTLTIALTNLYAYLVKAEVQYTLSAFWHILAVPEYGDWKIKSLSLKNFTIDSQIQNHLSVKLWGSRWCAEQQLHLVVANVISGQCVKYPSCVTSETHSFHLLMSLFGLFKLTI